MSWTQRPRKEELAPEEATGVGDQAEERHVVVCAQCEARITDAGARVEIDGRHLHTCVNPAAIAYRIGCYRSAPGAVPEGEPSGYFSWFAGCTWQVVVCGHCRVHLGWAFAGFTQ